MKFFLFVILVIAVIFGMITFQNTEAQDVSIQFAKWNFTEHIAILLAGAFGVGLLSGIVLLMPPWMKKASAARHFKKRIHELEEKLTSPPEDVAQSEHEGDAEHKPEEPRDENKQEERFNS